MAQQTTWRFLEPAYHSFRLSPSRSPRSNNSSHFTYYFDNINSVDWEVYDSVERLGLLF